MPGHNDTSAPPLGHAAIPELDGFDPLAFDALPIWCAAAAPDQRPVILVVDDERDVGRLLQRVLQDLVPYYDVIAATDPADALVRIRGRIIPLVITDFNMPTMNGIHLATEIRASTPGTQVLLMTAYPTRMLEQQVRQRAIDYYLPKPFALPDLEHIVEMALRHGEPSGPRP